MKRGTYATVEKSDHQYVICYMYALILAHLYSRHGLLVVPIEAVDLFGRSQLLPSAADPLHQHIQRLSGWDAK